MNKNKKDKEKKKRRGRKRRQRRQWWGHCIPILIIAGVVQHFFSIHGITAIPLLSGPVPGAPAAQQPK